MIKQLVSKSSQAISFLEELNINLELLSQCGGHRKARTHRSKADPNAKFQKNIGSIITSNLEKRLKEMPNVHIHVSSPVTKILRNNNGFIEGIQVNYTENILGNKVILTSGGYGRDIRFLEEFKKDYLRIPSTNGNFTTGDGIHLAREISAALVHMDQIQIHPTGIIDPSAPQSKNKFLAAEAIRASGAILINQEGKRFVNELGLRDEVTNAIFTNCKELPDSDGQIFAYMVLNKHVIDTFGAKIMSFYQSKGFLKKYANAEDFASKNSISLQNFIDTLDKYNKCYEENVFDEFNKQRFPCNFDPQQEIFAFLITPSIHYTMGGIKIDDFGRVIEKDTDLPIPNLYAAGEVTGGLHGKNRLAGNSLLECIVYGRIAANSALSNK